VPLATPSPGRSAPPGKATRPIWEAYDAECAAIARALRIAATKDRVLGIVTIFTDAQAAIWRMTSDDPGPGQKYAIMARAHRRKEPGVCIEIRWCPSHQGIEANEIADEWAKQAADEPDAHGEEWLDFKDPHGIVRKRRFPLPRSLANFKRDFSERKCREARTGSAPKQVPTERKAETGPHRGRRQ